MDVSGIKVYPRGSVAGTPVLKLPCVKLGHVNGGQDSCTVSRRSSPGKVRRSVRGTR